MRVVMFPGQGAQRVGMGADLLSQFPGEVRTADDILGYSLRELCLEGPAERLKDMRFTQPALFALAALGWLARPREAGAPEYLLGHSVGEYAALFAAEAFDFATGLALVKARGELMASATGGGMAAVLGLDADQVEAVLREHRRGEVHAANYNTPRQIVISGVGEAVAALESAFREAGASHFKILDVSGAFHTPYMADAQKAFRDVVERASIASPRIAVISNVTARPYGGGDVGALLVRQITAPVRWAESLRWLLAKGITPADVEEIAPAGVSVVKPMLARTNIEAGPLACADLDAPAMEQVASGEAQASCSGRVRGAGTGLGGCFEAGGLGSRAFCCDFGVRLPYLSGGMYQGIASVDVVVRMADAGLLGFFGAGGLRVPAVEEAILAIQARIPAGAPYGINFISNTNNPQAEDDLADLLMKHGVTTIEASAFMQVTSALVRYRAKGLAREGGSIHARHRIVAKVSRPDVAQQFLSPPPDAMLSRLVGAGALTSQQAELMREAPVADAICVEADSGGHTDQRMPLALFPAILALRDQCAALTPRFGPAYVGAAGGIGTPEAAAAMWIMGADFILTGSINQCTVEAATSGAAKDMLSLMDVHDTDYAPSGELFELGSKVQVLKKGIFFPARATKLVALYRQYESLDEIDGKTRAMIEERYLKRSFEAVFEETAAAYPGPQVERARTSPKHRMALVFRRYFRDSTRWALAGDLANKVDFQIQCGPAMGAFNHWAARNGLAAWSDRHVDDIGLRLMDETAALLGRRFRAMQAGAALT